MSMMKKIPVSALLASIALLSGCGGGGSSATSATPSGSSLAGAQTSSTSNTPPVTSSPNTSNTSNTPSDNSGTDTTTPEPTAKYAYILQAAANADTTTMGTNYQGGSVLKCALGADGSLSSCSTAGMPAVNHPVSITFSGSTAYVLNQTVPVPQWGGQYPVLRCAVEADGTLSSCVNTLPPGDSLETEDALKIMSGPASAYVLKERQLLKCPSDFSSKCGSDPSSISFSSDVSAQDMVLANNRIYVVNAGSSTAPASILSSSLDPGTGALSTPRPVSDASFAAAVRIDASTTDTPIGIAIKGTNAYILTRYGKKVIQCSYDGAANTITACTATAPLAALTGITPRNIITQGGYAYITDSSSTPAENSIVKCDFGSADGKIGNCAVASGPTYTTAIENLAFR